MDMKKLINIAPQYRPAPFWSFNDKLDKDEICRQIDQMAEKGWGGYFMHSRVGLVTKYLSDDWMDCIKACAQKAEETGTFAWLYDEDKWPSGYAGGEVSKNPDFRNRYLILINKCDITEYDKVVWENSDQYICVRTAALGNLTFNGMSYVDLMNPEAVKKFIECTHESYKEACGEYFGGAVPGIFTDEPCYLFHQENGPVLPWSECLPPFIMERKGYDIHEHVDSLFFEKGDYRKIRYDFFDCATRLFIESFTKQYYHWCRENNLIMTGHFMAEDSFTAQTGWIGAAMPHYEYMDWPGVDKLGRHLDQVVTIKQVTSAVEQLGKERAFCEVFGCIGQHTSFFHRKWIADWQAVLGISFVNHHLSLYSMRGERKRDYPANLFYQQPWWENEKEFADYIGRLSYIAATGIRELDVLVLQPLTSTWSEYDPVNARNWLAGKASRFDQIFEQLTKKLLAEHIDHHYGDEIIMENHARVENGRLVIGEYSYSTVILPAMVNMRASTYTLLKEFIAQAGAESVICLLDRPTHIEGSTQNTEHLKDTRFASNSDQVVSFIRETNETEIKIIDKAKNANADKIIYSVKQDEAGRIILVSSSEEYRETDVDIILDTDKTPYLIDLTDGQIYTAPVKMTDGRQCISARFYPAGSLVIYIPDEPVEANEYKAILGSGVAFEKKGGVIATANHFEVQTLEENVLPLNNATCWIEGREILTDKPISMFWHEHFYKLADGTPFKVRYAFNVENMAPDKAFAAIENAENLDVIAINGISIKAAKERGELGAFDSDKSWKDITFTKVDLGGHLKLGKNVLVIEGEKINNVVSPGKHLRVENTEDYHSTEAEAAYIVGDFAVTTNDNVTFTIDGSGCSPTSTDITSSGYPFYAGCVQFTANIDCNELKQKSYLQINKAECACLTLFVNGKQIGTKYWAPYVFDVTDYIKKGSNLITIKAATTLFNLMGPNRMDDIPKSRYISPHSFIDHGRFKEEYTLLPFGIGNIEILVF